MPQFRILPRGIGRGSAVVMAAVLASSAGAVYYSHYQQVRDRAVMRAGVERDKERLRQLKEKVKQQQGEERENHRGCASQITPAAKNRDDVREG